MGSSWEAKSLSGGYEGSLSIAARQEMENCHRKRWWGDNGIAEKVLAEIARCFEIERNQLLQRKRRVMQRARDVCLYLLKEHGRLDNKRIGEVFSVSLSAVTKAALRISEQTKIQKRFKKETDQILHSIFKA